MIEYRTGDILKSGADALVNAANARGVSGAGLAKAFKATYPLAQAWYEKACRKRVGGKRIVEPGSCWFCDGTPAILFAITKDDWRDPSRIEWIRTALDQLVAHMLGQERLRSVAVPALGCGLGGLRWDDVRPLIHAAAEKMSAAGVDVFVYEPQEQR